MIPASAIIASTATTPQLEGDRAAGCTPPDDRHILGSKNTILPENPAISPAGLPIVPQFGMRCR
jgi:hypothetical protein